MEIAFRFAVVVLALGAFSTFLMSLARTTILNRRSWDPVLSWVTRTVHIILKGFGVLRRSRSSADSINAWYMPLFILGIVVAWFSIVLCSFAALYWATGAEQNVPDALVASGSALTTLGFDTPTTRQGEVLGIIEGALGLMIIVFILTFVPGYQSAVHEREMKTAWLYQRLGPAPSGTALLQWLAPNVPSGDRAAFWEGWETWFRQIRSTHVLAPEVVFTPSIFSGQSWVICAHAVLDAASLLIATADQSTAAPAKLCVDAGIGAVREIAATIGYKDGKHPEPSLAAEAVDEALHRLTTAGMTVPSDQVEVWKVYGSLRDRYAGALAYISAQTSLTDSLKAGTNASDAGIA